MIEINHFRVDTLKLADEAMPDAAADGVTCYEVDTGKFYIYYKGQWYLQGEEETPAEDDTEPTEPTDENQE